MIIVIANMRINPGSLQDLQPLAAAAVAATSQEEGCISYRFLTDPADESSCCFVEEWQDAACLKAHTRTAHFLAWREQSAPFVLDRNIKLYDGTEISLAQLMQQ